MNDSKKTQILTIEDKNTNKAMYITALKKDDFVKEFKDSFKTNNTILNSIYEKVSKLGFITDSESINKVQDIDLKKFEINKSSYNKTITFKYDNKIFTADMEDNQTAIAGLEKVFGIKKNDAVEIFNKGINQKLRNNLQQATNKAQKLNQSKSPSIENKKIDSKKTGSR